MKGIDISEYQERVNYSRLKDDGIEFAIIRCGFGKNSWQKDKKFEEHYQGCKNAGLKIGAYLFSYANTLEGATKEAENCLNFIKGKSFDLPIFYDLEDKDTTGLADKKTITNMTKIFCDKIEEAGYQAGVYASLYWFNDKMYVNELLKYNIWLAQWNEVCQAQFRVDIWQYTSDGHISAINGRIDMDTCYKDYNGSNDNGDDEEMKVYQNGSTREPVYSDTDCSHQIGFLNPHESCDCYGIFYERAVVRYKVDGTNNYKVGFCKWLEGVR